MGRHRCKPVRGKTRRTERLSTSEPQLLSCMQWMCLTGNQITRRLRCIGEIDTQAPPVARPISSQIVHFSSACGSFQNSSSVDADAGGRKCRRLHRQVNLYKRRYAGSVACVHRNWCVSVGLPYTQQLRVCLLTASAGFHEQGYIHCPWPYP